MSYNRRTLSPDSPYAIAAALLFFAAAAIRTVGFILSYSGSLLALDLVIELCVPALCCIVFGAMLLSRKKSLIPTVIPLIGGSVYIIFRAFGLELRSAVALTALYALFGLVYVLTVTGIMGTRRVLMGGCVLVAALCIFMAIKGANAFGILAVVLTLAGIFCESMGMRRGRLY
ncbi:MAG: hypothetical protein ACI3XI_05060 [Eubacteriales bacterium]